MYLKTNTQLFKEINEDREWQLQLNQSLYNEISKEVIINNLPHIFNELGCVLVKDKEKFLQPTNNVISDTFIQVTPSLHEQSKALQIGKWFANAILNKLDQGEDTILLISNNAPSELLAKIIEDELQSIKTYSIGLNLYDKASTYLEYTSDWENIPVFIINDVYDNLKTIDEKEYLINKGFKLKGVLTFINLTSKITDEIELVVEWKNNTFILNEYETELDLFIFCNYKKPSRLLWKELTDSDIKNLRLVESYSTHDFKLERLRSLKEDNLEKLKSLENLNILREGHWTFEKHHFSVTICFKKLFSNSYLSGWITKEVLQIIRERDINTILIPLHSHIKEFIPGLMMNIKMHIGINVNYYYCISAKGLSSSPFYLLPRKVENDLRKSNIQYRILILDDAVATGRTQETLIRALVRNSKMNKIRNNLENISIYTVINRMSRAKSTFYNTIDYLSIQNKSVKFSFDSWLSLDLPVSDKDNCPLCKDREKFTYIGKNYENFNRLSVVNEINSIIQSLIPHSTESPTFINSERRNIYPDSRPIHVGGLDIASVELGVWQFSRLVYRGYPFINLIHDLDLIITSPGIITKSLTEFKILTGKILIQNWSRVKLQYSEDILTKYINDEIDRGTKVAQYYLIYMGEILPQFRDKTTQDKIKNLFIDAISKVEKFERAKQYIQRENLHKGISIGLITYAHSISEIVDPIRKKNEEDSLTKILNDIEDLSEKEKIPKYVRLTYKNIIASVTQITKTTNRFLYALIWVLENTIRPSRTGHFHEFLLPSLIESIGNKTKLEKANRDAIVDSISFFINCVVIINLEHSILFDDNAEKSLNNLLHHLNALVVKLENVDSWESDKPNFELSELANLTYNFFPHNKETKLYRSLIETHYDLNRLVEFIKNYCEDNNVELHLALEGLKKRGHFVIKPTEDRYGNVLKGFIKNYLSESTVNKPKVKLIIPENNKRSETVFILNTYIHPFDEVEKLKDTHGTNIINNSYYELFGVESFIETFDNNEYNAQIRLKFLNGYNI